MGQPFFCNILFMFSYFNSKRLFSVMAKQLFIHMPSSIKTMLVCLISLKKILLNISISLKEKERKKNKQKTKKKPLILIIY